MYNFKIVGLETKFTPVILLHDNDVVVVSLNYIKNRAKHRTLCDATKNIKNVT